MFEHGLIGNFLYGGFEERVGNFYNKKSFLSIGGIILLPFKIVVIMHREQY